MELEIGEVARRAGLRPSAVRYYEWRGLIAPVRRRSGRRLYDAEAVERLALISFAKKAGFSLHQIRTLLLEFRENVRWSELVATKLAELDGMTRRIEEMRAALHHVERCRCADVGECAHRIAEANCR